MKNKTQIRVVNVPHLEGMTGIVLNTSPRTGDVTIKVETPVGAYAAGDIVQLKRYEVISVENDHEILTIRLDSEKIHRTIAALSALSVINCQQCDLIVFGNGFAIVENTSQYYRAVAPVTPKPE